MAPGWLQGRWAGGWWSSTMYLIIAGFPKRLLSLSVTESASCSAAASAWTRASRGLGQRMPLAAATQLQTCHMPLTTSPSADLFTHYLLIESGRKEASSSISSCWGYTFNKPKPGGTMGVWEQGRWMTGPHLSGRGNGKEHGCTVPFGSCCLSSCKMKPHARRNDISSCLVQ